MSKLIFAVLALFVMVQAHDRNASDIETYKYVSASLGSYVIANPKGEAIHKIFVCSFHARKIIHLHSFQSSAWNVIYRCDFESSQTYARA